MVNYSFYIIARSASSKEIVLRINIGEWHELLFTLCPKFSAGTQGMKFRREDVLLVEEMELLDKITYDQQAVSISEGYEEFEEPHFENGYKWLGIITKIEAEYFKNEKEKMVNEIKNSINDELGILKIIKKARSDQYQFDQIRQSLEVAIENKLEVAFTISDY